MADLGAAAAEPARLSGVAGAVAQLHAFAVAASRDLDAAIAAARDLTAASDAAGNNKFVYTPGRRACIEAGAPAALAAFARSDAAQESAAAVRWISAAVRNLARSPDGKAACVAEPALAPALMLLVRGPAASLEREAAQWVLVAIGTPRR